MADKMVVQASNLCDGSRFKEDLGADSLHLVELVMGLEDKFKLTISDEEAKQITTVGEAVDHIQRALQPETVSA